jgi:hypothetical protein
VSNADAQDWVSRVYSNGGTVSTGTANAVNSFCNAIDAAGIRDRFARLNLMAGTGLNAALVPLYRSTSFGGSLLGNATDTNVGPFVSGDYAENDGLTASATKYLNTGLAPSTVGVSTGHLSIWAKGAASSSAALGMGSRTAGATQRYELSTAHRAAFTADGVTDFYAASAYGATTTVVYQQTGDPTRPVGLYLITRTSGTQLDFYLNSTSVANSTASATPDANANPIFVHARNQDGTAGFLGAATSRGYSIGLSMNSSQVSSFYTAWNAFQTALGRT